jgi:hypothetical protein
MPHADALSWAILSLIPCASARATDGAAPLPRDAILFEVAGDRAGDWFGFAVAGIGDLDGDGVADFAVGAHQNRNGGAQPMTDSAGYVRAYSGADGRPLATWRSRDTVFPNTTDGHFGIAMTSLPDADGDGARELVVGSYLHDTLDMNCGALFAFSGTALEPSAIVRGDRPGNRLGFALDTLPDLDGDGAREVLAGSPKEDRIVFNGGSLRILSGRDLRDLARIDGLSYDAALGFALAVVGDVDGDGVADFVAGAPYGDRSEFVPAAGPAAQSGEPPLGHEDEGQVVLFSGRDLRPLACWYGDELGGHLGWSVAATGDLDGDGTPDFAAGASHSQFNSVYAGPGYVRAWSGRDGRLLWQQRGGADGDQFGWAIEPFGRPASEGPPVLLIGAPGSVTVGENLGRPGRVFLCGGRDGGRLAAFWGRAVDDQFGAALADLGDLDGDGHGEVLVGAPQNTPGQPSAGYALVLSGRWLAHAIAR